MADMVRAAFLFFLCLSLPSGSAYAQQSVQSRGELEKQRASIQQEIENVKKSLDQTKRNRKETLGQLNLLQKRLKLRMAAISNITQQIDIIQSDMSTSMSDISK